MNSSEPPWHLFFPFLSSLLFPVGLMFAKKAGQRGIGSWTIVFVANLCAATVFSSLWLMGGARESWSMMWQPGIVATLYISGQVFTFLAIDRGDVSVATPVMSVKVVMVAVFLTVLNGTVVSPWVWMAACGATLGVAMIQRSAGGGDSRKYLLSVGFALIAAMSFATFDVLVQRWAPAWGAGSFLPIMFWMAGFMSLGFLPRVQFSKLRSRGTLALVMAAGILISLQALFLVTTIGFYADAARINIVYSLRGLWAVLLAWIFARWLGAGESKVSSGTMVSRLLGALLLTVAVVVAIVAG